MHSWRMQHLEMTDWVAQMEMIQHHWPMHCLLLLYGQGQKDVEVLYAMMASVIQGLRP